MKNSRLWDCNLPEVSQLLNQMTWNLHSESVAFQTLYIGHYGGFKGETPPTSFTKSLRSHEVLLDMILHHSDPRLGRQFLIMCCSDLKFILVPISAFLFWPGGVNGLNEVFWKCQSLHGPRTPFPGDCLHQNLSSRVPADCSKMDTWPRSVQL